MATNLMYNYLELAYSPICNYDFSLIKDDAHFQSLTSNSTLYMITQRSELTFEELSFKFVEPNQIILECEIRQKNNNSVLKCEVPIYQANLASDFNQEIKFYFEYALPKPNPLPQTFPQYNIRNLLLTYHNDNFIGWLSAENLIQNYLNGVIDAKIIGPIENFIAYKVHYVGKATEQKVWKRLTGHSALQDILSIEYPLSFQTLPTHEIVILFFKFREAFKLHTISVKDKITTDAVDSLMGKNLPNSKIISLDAEKAFIKCMQPKYNKEYYNNYPKSKDGLYSYDLDSYSFQIHSPIILKYVDGEIIGNSDFFKSDSIVIKKNQPLQILRNGIEAYNPISV